MTDQSITLEQWSEMTGNPATRVGRSKMLYVDLYDQNRPLLWSLEDHAISSVCGDVIWLVPKFEENSESV